MAYQTRGRDPLLDSSTQAALERRSKELLGLGLIALGLLSAMMIFSYSPDDPNWLVATDAPVQNWLGRFGASLAHPLFTIVGLGFLMVPLAFLVWGLRFATHRGSERAMSRAVFAPIAVALAAIYSATLAVPEDWRHLFGLGGMFGDTALSMVLTVLPFGAGFAAKLLSLLIGIAMLALAGHALGFTKAELHTGWRFFLFGLVVLYETALRLGGQGARLSVKAAQAAQVRVAEGIEARREAVARDRAERAAEALAIRAVPDPETKARVAAAVRANPVMPVARPEAAARVMPTAAKGLVNRAAPPRPSPMLQDADEDDLPIGLEWPSDARVSLPQDEVWQTARPQAAARAMPEAPQAGRLMPRAEVPRMEAPPVAPLAAPPRGAGSRHRRKCPSMLPT